MILFRKIKSLYVQLLFVDRFRQVVAYARFLYFTIVRKRLRTFNFDSKNSDPNTVKWNLLGINFTQMASARSSIIVRPLSVIESLPSDPELLAIGPRTEGELLLFVALGFNPKKIRGLDLISYSPWVDCGDMHQIPHPDNSFDVVTNIITILYSSNREKVASEMIRVVRNGGVIAVNVEYNEHPMDQNRMKESRAVASSQSNFSEIKSAGERILTVQDMLKLFGNHVDKILFAMDPRDMSDERRIQFTGVPTVSVIFSVKK